MSDRENSDEKEPMQASGEKLADVDDGNPPSAARPDMEENRGQSGGGAYPNPHNDPEDAKPEDGFMGHGGQSDMRYYGDGQLGSKQVGERRNATTEDED